MGKPMRQPHGDQYRARALECAEHAAATRDAIAKSEWVKLANSWQVLAERTEKPFEIVLPTSQSV
jgi:hypothetical protein